jgi:succinyl-diaminopimelate desuccinylase
MQNLITESIKCGVDTNKFLVLIAKELHGWRIEFLVFDNGVIESKTKLDGTEKNVNLFAYKSHAPSFMFLGHGDVVPAKDYNPVIDGDIVYGRGICDMRGAVIAFIDAAKDSDSVSILITCDEESSSTLGAIPCIEYLKSINHTPGGILVGEPTSKNKVGDTVKIGRRGSIHFELTINGAAGHVAYVPEKNPINFLPNIITGLNSIEFKKDVKFGENSSLVFYDIKTDNDANNKTPSKVIAKFNVRFVGSKDDIISAINKKILELTDSKYDVIFTYDTTCEQYMSSKGPFTDIVISKSNPEFINCSGGASDGRFAVYLCKDICELGLIGATMHKDNEHSSMSDIIKIRDIYKSIIDN